MTRVTNFGIKRTYVEAGFDHEAITKPSDAGSSTQPKQLTGTSPSAQDSGNEGPPEKRKRAKKNKKHESSDNALEGMDSTSNVKVANGKGKQKKKFKTRDDRLSSSEKRRQKRVSEKQATTTCFACREKGHSARNCPKTGDGDQSKKVVGMCYRCGSTRHTLSRCKKPEDLSNPLPFASCFVCNGKGHLASACPQNRDKGVYPNGGCCKLCGETTHLAKDCDLRKKDTNILARVIGIDDNVGADEDDFHIIGRRKHQLDKDERQMEKSQRLKDVKVGAQSGIIKSFGKEPATLPKKVVYF